MVVAACTSDVTFGQVEAIDDGSGMLDMRACLDAQLFSCDGQSVVLTTVHDDSAGTMTFAGIIFPRHVGSLPLGNAETPIVVADGDARVEMRLPTAFEPTSDVTGPLHSADTVHVRWHGADEPMVWHAHGTCNVLPTYPSGTIETIDDDGTLDVSIAALEKQMERSLSGCAVDIELSRVREGSVDDAFRAESATGIVRRTVTVTVE
jgi:hypothetical protein